MATPSDRMVHAVAVSEIRAAEARAEAAEKDRAFAVEAAHQLERSLLAERERVEQLEAASRALLVTMQGQWDDVSPEAREAGRELRVVWKGKGNNA